jgi:tricorn protease interacting factor F2/3
MEEGHETLGRDVIPVHYALKLQPDLKAFSYTGTVIIKLSIRKMVSDILLNAGNIKIRKAILYQKTLKHRMSVSHDRKKGLLELRLPKRVRGSCELAIEFSGKNNDSMYGFYRTMYMTGKKKRYNLTTHFEPADARQMMPCFDEPELKATFAVSLVVDREMETVSNMPIKGTNTLQKGKKLVVFETTPRMSSYLLYIGVGKYDIVEGKYHSVRLRVLTTPGKRRLALLPMNYLKKFLEFQERYFGIKYVLPKLDLIAVPDFSHGAMENWGAIAFRETALLDDIKTASRSSRLRIAEVIAHELAHQWFGDLVTMRWWDEIWLNESFADFIENKSVDKVFPQWQTKKRYKLSVIGSAMAADQLKSTHPIYVKINTPEEVNSVFDAISYGKGSSVLTMLEAFVGENIFRKGLHAYLSSNRFSNAEGRDLWESVQNAANASGKKLPVSGMMEAWINKPGFPVIDVKKESDRFIVSQKRFTVLKEYKDSIWPIPLQYMTEKGEGKMMLNSSRGAIADGSPWIKLNHGQAGFYRIRYSADLLRELGPRIRENEIDSIDAWGVINDLFTFVRSGRESLDSYIDFVNTYCLSCGFPANSAIMLHLEWLNRISYSKPFIYKIRRSMLSFDRRIMDDLGWEVRKGDDLVTISIRNAAMVGLGNAGDREAIEKGGRMLSDHFSGKKRLDPNMIMPVYSLAAINGDRKLFDRFLGIYEKAKIPVEKIYGLQALGMFNDRELAERALQISMSGAVRLQDKIFVAAQVAANPMMKDLFWDWEKENWKKLMGIFGAGTGMLDDYVMFSAIKCDEKDRDGFASFFREKGNKRGDINRAIAQASEMIEANIAFINKNARE